MATCDAERILTAAEPLTGKWKLELLSCLASSPARWNELVKSFPEAAPNVLTRQLRELERDGLVRRMDHSSKPPKVVEYRLTEAGEQYIPFLTAVEAWHLRWQWEAAV